MIDIYLSGGGKNNLQAANITTQKAKNLIYCQEGSLEYMPNFGVDLKLFFSPKINIQDETFVSYILKRFSENGISPIEHTETIKQFSSDYTFTLTSNEDITEVIK